MDNIQNNKNGLWAKWVGVAAVAILVALLARSCDKWGTTVQPPKVEPAKVNKIEAPVANKLISLSGVNQNGRFVLNGSVPSSGIKMQMDGELKRIFGADNYVNNLTVDATIKAPNWFGQLSGLFDHFKLPGSEVTVHGDVITLSGTAASLKDRLQTFLGASTKVNLLNIDVAAQTATKGALDTLNTLVPESPAPAVLDAMSLQIINFASGSTEIPAENQVVLKKAAQLLKTKKDFTFEVSGHADNQGSAASNLALSNKRAQAVRRFLIEKAGLPAAMITAKGYGDVLPVADNATETGRLKNRRIAYKVL